MRGIDTNVLVKFVTRDDAEQFRRVREGPGDFADYLIGERNRGAGCISTATLARRLKSAPAFQLV